MFNAHTVLLVENCQISLVQTAVMFLNAGWRAVIASNITEASKNIQLRPENSQFDLLLIDLERRELDQVHQEIGSLTCLETAKNIPIIEIVDSGQASSLFGHSSSVCGIIEAPICAKKLNNILAQINVDFPQLDEIV